MVLDASVVQSGSPTTFRNVENSDDQASAATAGEKKPNRVRKSKKTIEKKWKRVKFDDRERKKKKIKEKRGRRRKKEKNEKSCPGKRGRKRQVTTYFDLGDVQKKSKANLNSECLLYEQMRLRYYSLLHHFDHLRSRYGTILERMQKCDRCRVANPFSSPPPPPAPFSPSSRDFESGSSTSSSPPPPPPPSSSSPASSSQE